MKATTIFWLSMIVICTFGIYQLKYAVRNLKSEVAVLEAEVGREYKSVHVLEAEWAYLTRPDRLQKLAKKYFQKMEPLNGQQLLHASAVAALPTVKKDFSEVLTSNEKAIKSNNPMLQPVSGMYHE